MEKFFFENFTTGRTLTQVMDGPDSSTSLGLQKLTWQSIAATKFTDSFHHRVSVSVVGLSSVASPTASRGEHNEPLQCVSTQLTSRHVQIPRAYNLIKSSVTFLPSLAIKRHHSEFPQARNESQTFAGQDILLEGGGKEYLANVFKFCPLSWTWQTKDKLERYCEQGHSKNGVNLGI